MLAVADRIDARYYEPCVPKPLAPKKGRSQRQKAIWRRGAKLHTAREVAIGAARQKAIWRSKTADGITQPQVW